MMGDEREEMEKDLKFLHNGAMDRTYLYEYYNTSSTYIGFQTPITYYIF